MSTRTPVVLLTSLLAAVLLVPGAAADGSGPGAHPCDGGYYLDLVVAQTSCLPGLGFTGIGQCSGPYGPGFSIVVDGKEVACFY